MVVTYWAFGTYSSTIYTPALVFTSSDEVARHLRPVLHGRRPPLLRGAEVQRIRLARHAVSESEEAAEVTPHGLLPPAVENRVQQGREEAQERKDHEVADQELGLTLGKRARKSHVKGALGPSELDWPERRYKESVQCNFT